MTSWTDTLRTYTDRRVAAVWVMGFASGLPLLLASSTLTAWMTEAGTDLQTIGLFALASTPYAFKFLWAPLIDGLALPGAAGRLGRRRAWIVAGQIGLVVALAGIACADPARAPLEVAVWALALSALSATQDIAIDAYRVELLPSDLQGAGAAAAVFGYRIAMLVSGAGALVLASAFEIRPLAAGLGAWQTTYLAMSALMALLVAWTVVGAPSEAAPPVRAPRSAREVFETYVVAPFTSFARRRGWAWVLLFVVCFKLADALASALQNPFLLTIGFEKSQIAAIAKTYGLAASLAGALAGGALVRRIGLGLALSISSVLMLGSNAMFAWQAAVGPDPRALTLTITVENVSGGFGTAAFVAYLSGLCDRAFTATQYALLSSLSSIGRSVLSTPAGWMVAVSGWVGFYYATVLAGVPALILLLFLWRTDRAGLDLAPSSAR